MRTKYAKVVESPKRSGSVKVEAFQIVVGQRIKRNVQCTIIIYD